MQVSKYAVLASVIALVACGGGDQSAESAPAAAPAATTYSWMSRHTSVWFSFAG